MIIILIKRIEIDFFKKRGTRSFISRVPPVFLGLIPF